jgi:ComF family protein
MTGLKSGFSAGFSQILSNLLRPATDFLYPPVCLGCEKRISAKRFVCDNCLADELEPLPPRIEASVSGVLLPSNMIFQDALWVFHKKQLVQQLLHAIKYQGLPDLAVEMGELLGKRLGGNGTMSRNTILVPVPLHPARLRSRGYNQAEEIARGVQRVTGWPIAGNDVFKRIRNTRTQTGFTMEKRQENIASAFLLTYSGQPYETALIIDDVFTTGATVFEIARVLVPLLATQTAVATVALA